MKFKSFPDKELEETLVKINERLKAGTTIEEALLFIHCYGAIDELLRLRSESQQIVEKRTQLERLSIANSLLAGVKEEMRDGQKEDLKAISKIADNCIFEINEITEICFYSSLQQDNESEVQQDDSEGAD